MNNALIDILQKSYKEVFSIPQNETLLFSPGRINLLGEHVDYNDGKMLPAAIDLGIYLLGERRNDQIVQIYSLEYDQFLEIDLALPIHKSEYQWANYIIGVIAQFKKEDIKFSGFNLAFTGDLPIGAGLSSSAALECGVAFLMDYYSGSGLSRVQMALMAQKAEHEYAGVHCGIMDQMACILGREDMIILYKRIDVLSLTNA